MSIEEDASDSFPTPDQPYTVEFDEENGSSYLYCQKCCYCFFQIGCFLLCCLPCIAFYPSNSFVHCQRKRCDKQDVTITDKQIEYKKGWLIRKKLNIPIDRVQEVVVEDDWVLRFFGIKNSVIRTATEPDVPPEALLIAPKWFATLSNSVARYFFTNRTVVYSPCKGAQLCCTL